VKKFKSLPQNRALVSLIPGFFSKFLTGPVRLYGSCPAPWDKFTHNTAHQINSTGKITGTLLTLMVITLNADPEMYPITIQ